MNCKPDKGREKGSKNSDRNNKIKDLKRRLAAFEAKTAQADYDSESDSSYPASHIKGRSRVMGQIKLAFHCENENLMMLSRSQI